MSDIIAIITKVEDDSYDNKAFKKVTLGTGQVLKVKQGREGALKAKWGLLQEGIGIKFIMQDYTKPDGVKIPFVSDIESVEGQLVSKEETTKELERTLVIPDPPPKPEPAPQAVGMMTKEIGDFMRLGVEANGSISSVLNTILGKEATIEIIRWWRSQALGISRIPHDGEKLPTFEKGD